MEGRVVPSTCAGLLPYYFGLDWNWIGILCSAEQKHKRYAFLSYLFPFDNFFFPVYTLLLLTFSHYFFSLVPKFDGKES